VKCGVEGRHHGDIGAERITGGTDGAERGLVAQGRKLAEVLNGLYDRVINGRRLDKAISPMHHT